MSPRWDWEFEDEKRPTRQDTPTVSSPLPAVEASPSAKAPNRVRIRRRRATAAAIVIAVLVILIAALTGSAQRRPSSPSRGSLTAHRAPAVPMLTPAQVKAAEDRAVGSVLAFTPFVKEGGTSGRDIALTFDDGPGPYTPQVLSVLERLHVRGTFFAIGKMLRYFSESTVREIRDGDVIGDHTESHPMMATLSAHDQHEELFEQIARIELLDGPRPTLFRPPYGSFDATTLHELHAMHLLMVLWSVDTDDYQQPGVSVIVQRALEGAHPGAIILMHDAGGVRTQTIAALPIIIAKLRAKGYDLVTVPQLLKDDPPPTGQPIPPNLSGD
jgi:peptidoglycan-N-acetylglucosamine deacetylase